MNNRKMKDTFNANRLYLALSLTLSPLIVNAQFKAIEELSELDGSNGLRLDGVGTNARSGRSVSSAGDFNGDGIDDVIIGSYNSYSQKGVSYVVFGKPGGFSTPLNLGSLIFGESGNGLILKGVENGDKSGFSVSSAGDINGDGIDDVIIGAPRVDTNVGSTGASYVVFGSSDGFQNLLGDKVFSGIKFLSSVDGTNGFVVNGINTRDSLGFSVSAAGDVNGDGFDDVIIGAPHSTPVGFDESENKTTCYVIFGHNGSFTSPVDLTQLDGGNGFKIEGITHIEEHFTPVVVSSAGDINGDGFDDVMIGATYVNNYTGAVYIVFGGNGLSEPVNLSNLDGSNGFILNGVSPNDRSGESINAIGDINGDGIDDIIIGAPRNNPNGIIVAGTSYVVFGHTGSFSTSFNLSTLNGNNGFTIHGNFMNGNLGRSVNAAGDINGDGLADIIIGAPDVDTNGISESGVSYVLFGRSNGFQSPFNITEVNGSNGFVIHATQENEHSGTAVSNAGDINGDSIDDLIIGAPGFDTSVNGTGTSYVLFGDDTIFFNNFENQQ